MGWKKLIGETVGSAVGYYFGGTAGAAAGKKLLGGVGKQMDADRDRKRTEEKELSLWNMQNEYNSPAAQMERYVQAGLNPNLIAGSLGSGTAGSVGSAHSSEIDNDLDLVGAYEDIRQRDAMTQNLHAQADTAYKNNFINRAKLGMERERLNADLIHSSNQAHLQGVQYGILNNQLRMSQNALRQSDLDLKDRETMRPYELQALRRDLKYKGSGIYNSMRRVGAVTGAFGNLLGGMSDAVSSHLAWHRD